MEIQNTGYDTRDRLTLSEFGARNVGQDSNFVGQDIARFIHTRESPTLADISEYLVGKYGIELERAESDVAEYADMAQKRGYASLESTLLRSFSAIVLRRFLEMQVLHPKDQKIRLIFTRRRNLSPTNRNVILRVGLASLINSAFIVLVLSAVFIGLAALIDLRIDPSFGQWYPFTVGLTLLTHVMASVLHEGAHIEAARRLGVPVHNLSVERVRASIQRTQSTPRNEFIITILGPLVGIAVSALIVGVLVIAVSVWDPDGLTRGTWAMLVVLPSTAVVSNASTLIPPSDDGKALWYALARLHRERRHDFNLEDR